MSSEYAALCLSHDPAIVVSPRWQSLDMFRHAYNYRAAAPRPRSELSEHAHCDLMVGRWSGGLVQVGCPPSPREAEITHYPYHPHSFEWLDAWQVHVLLAASVHVIGKVRARVPGCWSTQRINRLADLIVPADELPIPVPQGDDESRGSDA